MFISENMKWVAMEGVICCVCGTVSSNVKCGASAVCVEQRVVMLSVGHLLCVWNSE